MTISGMISQLQWHVRHFTKLYSHTMFVVSYPASTISFEKWHFLNFYFEREKKKIISTCHNGCLGHTALFCCCPFHSETKMSSKVWNKCETHKWDATPKYSLTCLCFVHVNSNVWSSIASQKLSIMFSKLYCFRLTINFHQSDSIMRAANSHYQHF